MYCETSKRISGTSGRQVPGHLGVVGAVHLGRLGDAGQLVPVEPVLFGHAAAEGPVRVLGVGHQEERAILGLRPVEQLRRVPRVVGGVAPHAQLLVRNHAQIPGEPIIRAEVGDLAQDARQVVPRAEQLVQDRHAGVDVLETLGAVAVGETAGHQRRPARLAEGDRHVRAVEGDALAGQPVDVRREVGPAAEAAGRAAVHVVDGEEQDVRRRRVAGPWGVAPGGPHAEARGDGSRARPGQQRTP
ncbi:hypothetical protein ABGB14_29695 [Nonomuraea sp. B10E15]|uniref:hypothetical protein n=1 Tax=Nonomuraea sp. B10E15 TaxID=3153560 RepID=UPI00325E5AAF